MTKEIPKPQYFIPTNLQSADYARQVFRYSLDKAFSKEDLLDTKNWRQVVKSTPMLSVGDIIEVLREDNTFYSTLLVTGKVNDDLFVKIITFTDLEKSDKSTEKKELKSSDYEITWKGPQKKFTLIRLSDNKELKDKFASKDEANHWFKNNY